MHANRHGFTLLELSLVLTIIGLIVGAVFVGQSIVHSAELQSIIADADRFKKAALTFKDKYKEFPGDMPNATNVWGSDAGCPTPAANATPKAATCNGDGNGYISGPSSSIIAIAGDTAGRERFIVWQHLANAGLIESQYTGVASPTTGEFEPGLNTPRSKINNTGYTLFYVPSTMGVAGAHFQANYRHVIVFGKNSGAAGVPTLNPAISGIDAAGIDQKMDDGRPGKGNVMGYAANAYVDKCVSPDVGWTEETAVYINVSQITCSLIFITGY